MESYGYKFLRINRFNLGEEPIKTLNSRLKNLLQEYTIPAEDGMLSKLLLFLQQPSVPGSIITFFLAAMSIMIYLVYYKNSLPNLNGWEHAERCEDVLTIRLAVNALVCLLPILAIFI